MLVQDFLHDNSARRPDKVALIFGGRRFTYAQLEGMAIRLAAALRDYQVKRGDRVAVYLGNSMEAVVGIFAALNADCAFVVVNRTTKPDKLRFILRNCGAAAILTDARALKSIPAAELFASVQSLKAIIVCDDANPSAGPEWRGCHSFSEIQATPRTQDIRAQSIDLDVACLIYTSGTTGEPKGVACDHGNVVFVAQSIVGYLKNVAEDVVLNVLPLSSSYGLYQLLATFCAGGTLVLEESFAFPTVILQRICEEQVTGFAGVPTIYSILLGMDLTTTKLPSLRYLTNAAASLPIEHVRKLRQAFPKVDLYLMHGLTEVARTMYLPPDQVDLRPGSSGIPIPGTELWIEDEAGNRLGPGEVGELVVRGRHVMRGYWADPEMTAEHFRPGPLPGERVCYSGDLFRTDEQGYYYFVSRKDDIIKSRGEKVSPQEVENVLYRIDGVQDAAVIGVPDPLLGRAIKAFIVPRGNGLTQEDVIIHCQAWLEDFMVPKYVEFRRDLPRTETGKIRKLDLH